jgi:glycerol uptake facilitator-like aquaporin
MAKKLQHTPMTSLLLKSLAEFLGTFIFIFLSLGGVQSAISVATGSDNAAKVLFIALMFGCKFHPT